MLNVLVFGAGVYVQGHNNSNLLGNIGSALIESNRRKLVGNVYIKSTSSSSVSAANKINHVANHIFAKSVDSNEVIDKHFLKSKEISAAIIALPDNLHYQYLESCARLGLHVIVVKPFVQTKSEADEIIKLYRQNGLLGFVEFHKRFDYSNLLLKDKLKGKNISRFLIDYSQDRSVPLNDFKKWSESTNIFQYLGVHYVDLIYWLTGASPVSASVFTSGSLLKNNNIDAHDNIDVVIRWNHNNSFFNSVHLTSWAESHGIVLSSRQKIEVLTEKNRVECHQDDRGFREFTDQGMEIINPYFSKSFETSNGKLHCGYGVDNYISFFETVLNNDGSSAYDDRLCTFSDAMVSVSVTEEVSNLLKNG